MRARKAQAGGAAGLIAIIAFIIVLYIMFLPSDVRENLLNQTTTSSGSTAAGKGWTRTTLVFEHPGTLDPVNLKNRDKVLDSFNLYTEKTAVVLKSVESVHVEKGWLREKTYNLSFKVTDLANTDNYVVAFDGVTTAYGRLILTLNGVEIYNAQSSIGNLGPIKLDKNLITNDNSLIISVSGVGLAFWSLNEYDLKNARVIADFTDVSKKEYKNTFILTATEKQNLETTKLQFVPNCLTKKSGPLQIMINGRDLNYQAVPDCGGISVIEFDPNILKQGENTVTFRAEEGNYLIDRVSVKLQLKTTTYPFYYFELTENEFNKVENDTANVTVELKFADLDQKRGALNVNGHLSSIDTTDSTFVKNINNFVEQDQNYLQITPKTILNIVDLKIVIAK